MADKDKPTVHFSRSQLTKEADALKPEPFVYVTGTGKRVTFPDIWEWGEEKAEAFLEKQRTNQAGNSAVLREWLSPDDFKAIQAEKFTLREINILSQHVFAHYEAGSTPGEGQGSED